jgi:hypothetical protein
MNIRCSTATVSVGWRESARAEMEFEPRWSSSRDGARADSTYEGKVARISVNSTSLSLNELSRTNSQRISGGMQSIYFALQQREYAVPLVKSYR